MSARDCSGSGGPVGGTEPERIAHLLQGTSPDQLMTPEERAESARVLREMADARSRAAFASRFMWLP